MADCMTFPDTLDEFLEQYQFKDNKEVYTNGSMLIQVFRVKQWAEHAANARENVKGKWIKNGWAIRCSECGYDMPFTVRNYCPNCGAQMMGGVQDD